MLIRYKMWYSSIDEVVYAENVINRLPDHVADEKLYVRWEDVEPLLKRLAELEAKEQKREQFDLESA